MNILFPDQHRFDFLKTNPEVPVRLRFALAREVDLYSVRFRQKAAD